MAQAVVVGRDVKPVVGMQVQEMMSADKRTGTISRVIRRVAAASQTSETLSCCVLWEEGADVQVTQLLRAVGGGRCLRAHHALPPCAPCAAPVLWEEGAASARTMRCPPAVALACVAGPACAPAALVTAASARGRAAEEDGPRREF